MKHRLRIWLVSAVLAFTLGCHTSGEVNCSSTDRARERHPDHLASDEVIRRNIVGMWHADAQSFSGRKVSFTFRQDRCFAASGAYAKEKYWRMDRGFVIVTAKPNELAASSDQFLGIWCIDDHELICRPGFSVAGEPWKFAR